VSGSNNLIGTDGSGGLVNGSSGNIVLTSLANLGLAPLGNYGGPTQTMALLPGSAAIDAGTSGTGIPTTDQRGLGRVGATDIGAVESQGYTLSVSGSGQAAIVGMAIANPLAVTVTPNYAHDPVNGGTINFAAPATGASATLSEGTATIAAGSASVTAMANSVAGAYTVTAKASGVATGASIGVANSALLVKGAGTYTDSDGDRYVVKLTGPGQVGVVLDDPHGTGKGPIASILLTDTNPTKSILSITVTKAPRGDGLVSIGSIVGTGLKALVASASNLVGTGINLSGPLGSLTIHDVLNGAGIVAQGTAAQSTTISAHIIGAGATIQLGSTIASLTATAAQGGSITAPSISKLTIAGNFAAAVTLTGTGDSKTPAALGSATIAGKIQGGAWNISGDAGTVTVGGTITGWTANFHGKVGSMTLGNVAQAAVTIDQALATLNAKSWTAGSLTADSLGKLSITGNLGANITLTGAGLLAQTPALGSATITGTVSGSSIRVGGSVTSFSAGAFLSSTLFLDFVPTNAGNPLGGGTFNQGFTLGSFTVTGLPHQTAPAFAKSTVAAATVGTVSLKSILANNGGQRYGIVSHGAIGSVRVSSPAFAYNKLRPTPQGSGDFEVEIA
jgi:hypothetical protein